MAPRRNPYGPIVGYLGDTVSAWQEAGDRVGDRMRRRTEDRSARGRTSEYDPLIQSQEEMARLRSDEGREMDRLVRTLEGAPAQLEQERGVATGEMRRQAALKLASIGGRDDVIGAGSAAKSVGQAAANIGTHFGGRIREAAKEAARARIERKQHAIESAVKPGIDVERIRASLQGITDRNKRDWTSKLTFGLFGQGAKPTALADEIAALEGTTKDPLARQLIAQVKANLEGGQDPFEDLG